MAPLCQDFSDIQTPKCLFKMLLFKSIGRVTLSLSLIYKCNIQLKEAKAPFGMENQIILLEQKF